MVSGREPVSLKSFFSNMDKACFMARYAWLSSDRRPHLPLCPAALKSLVGTAWKEEEEEQEAEKEE